MAPPRAQRSSTEASELELQPEEPRPLPRVYECDQCGSSFEGDPAGSGLLVWTRGEEVRREEPPLCKDCAEQLTVGALLKWDLEEEEEG
jgi:hypothetical protein